MTWCHVILFRSPALISSLVTSLCGYTSQFFVWTHQTWKQQKFYQSLCRLMGFCQEDKVFLVGWLMSFDSGRKRRMCHCTAHLAVTSVLEPRLVFALGLHGFIKNSLCSMKSHLTTIIMNFKESLFLLSQNRDENDENRFLFCDMD